MHDGPDATTVLIPVGAYDVQWCSMSDMIWSVMEEEEACCMLAGWVARKMMQWCKVEA